ncbi:MAG: phosphoribosylaminoimidazolesuccinocarboxamide synthase [Tissierellia bacterium]|nr:phosphoribosylaminoimidazolesuccinocarboxamide synthase [Tissierellia bacterium]
MQLVITGKTKNLYRLGNGNMLLEFKDDLTGKDGVFDPGANTVGLTMEGAGEAGLRVTKFFFETFKRRGLPTHYVDADLEKKTMEVVAAEPFGDGLECICRYRAVGSFYRRFGKYIKEGDKLDGLVEITIKDDEAGDPPITKDIAVMLGIATAEEYDTLLKLTKEFSDVIKEILETSDLSLYDLKLEFGKDKDGKIMLIDEISGGNMRVYKGDEYVAPLKLPELLLK